MGNDILRAVAAAVQRPFHDCAKYVLNSCDSECSVSDCCSCKVATHEVDDEEPSPPLEERYPTYPP